MSAAPDVFGVRIALETAWLRPLAAWFAGESVFTGTLSAGDRALVVLGDERALIWNEGRVRARLECDAPFGPAWVNAPLHRRDAGPVVHLSPTARQDVAALLRRLDAAHWIRPNAAA